MCAELVSAARIWPHLARIEFPLWVVGSNTFARLHEEPGHHMSWWSDGPLIWRGSSLRKTESFLAQTVFFFWKIKLQWNDDQSLIANLSIPVTLAVWVKISTPRSKVGTVRFVWHTSSDHPQHWVEITPWGAHALQTVSTLQLQTASKNGDRCSPAENIHDKELLPETQLLMCRPRGPELVVHLPWLYISGPFANVRDKIVQNSMWIFHWQKNSYEHIHNKTGINTSWHLEL